ncbi:MAG: pyridoxamine kinase [Clostridia bacterium]|nr:pyridoxamine kinase [Clostridia bacterium]
MNKRLVTIQDISCVGQCSLTVALPIISAMGIECCVLPTAVLSTHTAGFTNYTFMDLTDEIPRISAHWKKEKIGFDAIYTGYIGSFDQIAHISNIIKDFWHEGIKVVIDPVMADKGQLYKGFTMEFARAMSQLISQADVVVPNMTEASFLLGVDYVESGYDKAYIERLLRSFDRLTTADVVLTGVSFEQGKLGIAVYDRQRDNISYYFQDRIDVEMHGTGDVWASSFTGALLSGLSLMEAGQVAVDYTVECIKRTMGDKSHWYGVKFEQAIPYLIKRIGLDG